MAKTKASIVVMSHLSDIQVSMYLDKSEASTRINFAKYVILQLGGNLNQEIDADMMYAKFREPLKQTV